MFSDAIERVWVYGMRIAIITITNGANYGNRLQNYALQTVLTQLGHTIETIPIQNATDGSTLGRLKHKIKDEIKIILRKGSRKQYRYRKRRFDRFNETYVVFSSMKICCETIPDALPEYYDCFVCGSDQIWNTRYGFIQASLSAYLAAFAPREKKIAYAASFGTADIPSEYVSKFQSLLPEFHAISVREDSGRAIVQSLCQIDVPVVLDPTMLLSVDAWRKIEREPTYPCGKYVVTYILSEKTPALQQYAEHVMRSCGAERIIHLDVEFLDDDKIQDVAHYQTDPSEFLWLIDHAECVLTDSFHSTVFSILFHKPFMVFERQAKEAGNNMSSRIDTLLQTFGLSQFRDDIANPSKLPTAYDAAPVETILEKKRNDSMEFLTAALQNKA